MAEGPKFDYLIWEVEDHVGRLTLNRPPVNALNRKVIAELNGALDLIEDRVRSVEVRVLLLAASGPHFSAGADLKERQQIPDDQVETVVDAIRNTFQRIHLLPIPVVAGIQGSALGGGLELALAADLRVISDEAKVGLPETSLAIIPGGGGTQRLMRIAGYGKALYWIASGKIFSGLEAYQTGVADFLVKKEELNPFTRELCSMIAHNGPIAVQAAKQALQKGQFLPLPQALEIEKNYYRKTIHTRDRLEGIQAFLEKRTPHYQGK